MANVDEERKTRVEFYKGDKLLKFPGAVIVSCRGELLEIPLRTAQLIPKVAENLSDDQTTSSIGTTYDELTEMLNILSLPDSHSGYDLDKRMHYYDMFGFTPHTIPSIKFAIARITWNKEPRTTDRTVLRVPGNQICISNKCRLRNSKKDRKICGLKVFDLCCPLIEAGDSMYPDAFLVIKRDRWDEIKTRLNGQVYLLRYPDEIVQQILTVQREREPVGLDDSLPPANA